MIAARVFSSLSRQSMMASKAMVKLGNPGLIGQTSALSRRFGKEGAEEAIKLQKSEEKQRKSDDAKEEKQVKSDAEHSERRSKEKNVSDEIKNEVKNLSAEAKSAVEGGVKAFDESNKSLKDGPKPMNGPNTNAQNNKKIPQSHDKTGSQKKSKVPNISDPYFPHEKQ